MIEWLDRHLVPEWRKAWSFLSVRAAGLFAATISALAAQPDLLLGIINFMPTDPIRRAGLAIGVGLIAFFGPTVLRLWNQANANDAAE
jgi:hypothetical protein